MSVTSTPATPDLATARPTLTRQPLARHLAAIPFIYGMLLPIAALDAMASLYQAVCFRLWRMPRVGRSVYLNLERRRLPYLNPVQKLNCAYCSYANGVLAYVREIAARTEQYWCPIQHPVAPPAAHERYEAFLPYGDAADVQARMEALRRAVQHP